MMMTSLLLATLAAMGSPDPVEPRAACEAASMVLKDMRYVEGKLAPKGDFSHPKIKARLDSCVEVATLAAPHGRDVIFAAVAIGFNESLYRKGVVGADGELGRLQVLPGYHCKPYPDLNDGKGGCVNPERAGVRAIRLKLAQARKMTRRLRPLYRKGDACRWNRHRVPTICRALKDYNGSRTYASKVARFIRSIRWSYAKQERLARGMARR